jgi:hypothetical protein
VSRVVLLDHPHGLVHGFAEVGALRKVQKGVEPSLRRQVGQALCLVIGRPDVTAGGALRLDPFQRVGPLLGVEGA